MTPRRMAASAESLSVLKAWTPFFAAALVALIVGLAWVGPVLAQTSTSASTASSQTTGVASVSLNPSSDSVNAPVTISGTGFLPDRNVTATFGANPLTLTGICKTDSSGALSGCDFRVPVADAGTHSISVTDGTNVVVASFTVPSITIPESTFLVTLTSIGLGLVTQLATRRLVDLNAERRMKAEVSAFNKEKREATLKKDKARLEKLKKRELPMKQAQAKVSTARLKVTAVTFVPLLAVYYLMANFLGGFNVAVAHSPVPIPLLVGPDGTMVLFWWYLLSSFCFSTLLTKLMHTTT
jgi:uncharacterized membrane protein (DUF106 family)